jgi:hypothetical protein
VRTGGGALGGWKAGGVKSAACDCCECCVCCEKNVSIDAANLSSSCCLLRLGSSSSSSSLSSVCCLLSIICCLAVWFRPSSSSAFSLSILISIATAGARLETAMEGRGGRE